MKDDSGRVVTWGRGSVTDDEGSTGSADAQRPADGWPIGALGGQGTIAPIESGCYHIALERTRDGWTTIENHTILDLPSAM